MYDFEEYKNNMRDFYISVDELPGPIVKDEINLINEIKAQSKKFEYNKKYKAFNERFNPHRSACSLDVLNEFIQV